MDHRLLFWCFVLPVFLASSLLPLGANAQNRANVWYFGVGNGMDFNGGAPVNITGGKVFSDEGSSVMCDVNGNLLFYCNGDTIWDQNHNPMPNGQGLLGNASTTQSSVIVPNPASNSRYYVFTLDELGAGSGLQSYQVEMVLNGGLGDVIVGSNQALVMPATEKLTAVQHANGTDYWVVVHEWQTNAFYAFLVDLSGIGVPVVSNVGTVHGGALANSLGQMKISPDGKRIAVAGRANHLLEVFDFDAATGIVSNPLTLPTTADFPYGLEFSPDGTKVYMSYWNTWVPRILQFDLNACFPDGVVSSEIVIGTNFFGDPTASLQLAPDGQIYVATQLNGYLGIIHDPNELGLACNYQDSAYFLGGGTCGLGLPNFVTSYFQPAFSYENHCIGDVTSFNVTDTTGLDSITWNFGDPASGGMNTIASLMPGHVFSTNDTFQVQMVKHLTGGGTDTTIRSVIIYGYPTANIGADTTLCVGDSVILNASSPGASYFWVDSANTATVVADTAGIYWVDICLVGCTFRDSIEIYFDNAAPVFSLGPDVSICAGDSLLIDPDLPGVGYLWQDASTDTTQVAFGAGTYWLEASNGCGSNTDTLIVSENNDVPPDLNFAEDTLLCDIGTLNLDATTNGASYLWQDNSTNPTFTVTTPGIYWVQVANSCDTITDSTVVSYGNSPVINLGADTVICDDDTLALTISVDTAAILWHNGSTDSSFTVEGSGQFWVQATNSCGTVSDTISVTDYSTNPPVFELGPDVELCIGETAVLGDSGLVLFNYVWQDGSNQPTLTVSEEGVYSVVASNPCATEQDSVQVFVSKIIALRMPIDSHLCEGETATLIASDTLGATFLWENGSIGSVRSVTEAGAYWFTATDIYGCNYTDSIVITDKCPGEFFAPNVFTPNGDGLNDNFTINARNMLKMELRVYNRWGQVVFSVNQPGKSWDGTSEGGDQPAGVYYWQVQYTGSDQVEHDATGNVTLIR